MTGLVLLCAFMWLLWGGLRYRLGDRGWLRDMAAWGLLAVAVLAFYWRLVVGDAYMPADGGDMATFLYPNFIFNARALRSLSLPLWNPHVYGGYPYAGEVQSGLYYPINWPFFLWGTISYTTMEALAILHIWWAAVGAYTLARHLTRKDLPVSRGAALLAGLAFGLSDVFLVHFGNENLDAAVAWLPWVLWAALTAEEGGPPRRYPLTALFLALSLLAGHPQMALYVGLALGMVLILQGLLQPAGRSQWRYWVQLAGRWLPVGFVASLMAAILLLPGWEQTRFTARAGWTYGQSVGYSFAPGQFIGLLIPGFLGRGPQLYWGVWPRVEVGYVGIITLFLAALGTLRFWGRNVILWLSLTIAAFLISLGAYAPLHGWLTALFPPLQVVRAPARFLVVADLGTALLAALGGEALLEHTPEARAYQLQVYRWLRGTLLVTAGFVWPVLLIALLLGQNQDRVLVVRQAVTANAVGLFLLLLLLSWGLWRLLMEEKITPRLGVGFLLGLLLFDLAATGAYVDIGGRNPTGRYRHPNIAAFLHRDPGPFRVDSRTGIDTLWLPDTAVLLGLEDVNGVANPLVPAAEQHFLAAAGNRTSALYRLLNVKYIIASKKPPFDPARFPPVYTDDPQLNVYLNPRALPRAFLVRKVQPVPDQNAAWQALTAPDFDPARQAVVEIPPGEAPPRPGNPSPLGGKEFLGFAAYDVNGLRLSVRVNRPALLVLSEFWYPGWQARVLRVDGSEDARPVLRVDAALCGIFLRPGDREVRLVFRPRSWRWGAGASLLGGILWAMWMIGRRSTPARKGESS